MHRKKKNDCSGAENELKHSPDKVARKEQSVAILDEFCNPDNPKIISFQDVSAAAYKIKDGVQKTPCTKSQMSQLFNMDIYFKKEFLQFTGSFKERGARYTLMMLTPEKQKIGVIAASAGNHALALSYHGQDLGIPITVVMPVIAPLMKIQSCRKYGATVIIKGAHLEESRKHAISLGKEQGLTYINGYDHPHILAGQGTMGLEIVEQVPNLDACIIPVGGGGLLAGTAVAIKNLKPNVKIIGVESVRCASFTEAMKQGKPTFIPVQSSLADGSSSLECVELPTVGMFSRTCLERPSLLPKDNGLSRQVSLITGLAVATVGVNSFATAKPLIDKMLAVQEESIALSILRLIELEKAVVEGAGAAGLAAVLEGLLPELEGKKVVIALCGGNIDTTALGRVIERGLAVDGRLVRFIVTVSDRPGGIADLTRFIADLGVSIKDIFHERAWLKSDVYSVQVKCVVETRDPEHALELKTKLTEKYSHVEWGSQVF